MSKFLNNLHVFHLDYLRNIQKYIYVTGKNMIEKI